MPKACDFKQELPQPRLKRNKRDGMKLSVFANLKDENHFKVSFLDFGADACLASRP